MGGIFNSANFTNIASLQLANSGTVSWPGVTGAPAISASSFLVSISSNLSLGNNSSLEFGSQACLTGNTSSQSAFQGSHGDQSKSVQIPTTGFSITCGNSSSALILNPAGTLATGTITLPSSPNDGMEVRVSSTQTVTALTVTASQTIKNAPTTISAGTGFCYIWDNASTTWYRLY